MQAREAVREQLAHRSNKIFNLYVKDMIWIGAQIELYCGDGTAAWGLVADHWPSLQHSLLLHGQFVRVTMRYLRARCALAAAAVADPAPLLRAARCDAARLERERVPWAKAYAVLIRAGLAAARGDRPSAEMLLTDAAGRFDAADMALDAVATRRRLGDLIDGDRGAALRNQADDWMTSQGIRRPDRIAAVFAPDCIVWSRS
jgi:hypothetical protein